MYTIKPYITVKKERLKQYCFIYESHFVRKTNLYDTKIRILEDWLRL